MRYEDDEEDEEEYGHHEEIAALELYSLSARGEALLVRAVLDDRDFEVLVFKAYIIISGIFFKLKPRNFPRPIKECASSKGSDKVHRQNQGTF